MLARPKNLNRKTHQRICFWKIQHEARTTGYGIFQQPLQWPTSSRAECTFSLGKEAGHGNPALTCVILSISVQRLSKDGRTVTCSRYSFLKLIFNLIYKEPRMQGLDIFHLHTRDQCFLMPAVSRAFFLCCFNSFFPDYITQLFSPKSSLSRYRSFRYSVS